MTSDMMLRIGSTVGVPAALESLGLSSRQILSEVDVDVELFDNPDNLIPVSTRARLIHHCAARSQCPYFGLLVGQHSGLRSLGLVGLLTKYSPDVRTALKNLTRFFFLHNPGATVSLQVEGGIAVFQYHIKQASTDGNEQVNDGAVAVIFNVLNELCGPNWKAREARFSHKKPNDTRAYQDFFHTHLVFNAEQNGIVFLASWLNHPLEEANSDIFQLVRQQLMSQKDPGHIEFIEQVSSIIRSAIIRGNHKADYVAALFSMHTRTFHRRLKAYGTSYQKLVDETAYVLARQMLMESDRTLGDIALSLGYADSRSFNRAFRRWSGTTPARWRAEQKQWEPTESDK